MTKQEIFNYFYTNSANLGIISTFTTMTAGLVIAAIIFATYYFSTSGVNYDNKFNFSLVALTLISIVIMLMISSNIVISLGMVGALSIVRFRTAIKDSRDTVFIFWAISEGLSVGSQNFKLAIITTLFIGIILITSNYIPMFWNKYILVIRGNDNIDITDVLKIISSYTIYNKLRVANKNENNREIMFEVKTKGELNPNIINELSKIKGISQVNYVIESGETVG